MSRKHIQQHVVRRETMTSLFSKIPRAWVVFDSFQEWICSQWNNSGFYLFVFLCHLKKVFVRITDMQFDDLDLPGIAHNWGKTPLWKQDRCKWISDCSRLRQTVISVDFSFVPSTNKRCCVVTTPIVFLSWQFWCLVYFKYLELEIDEIERFDDVKWCVLFTGFTYAISRASGCTRGSVQCGRDGVDFPSPTCFCRLHVPLAWPLGTQDIHCMTEVKLPYYRKLTLVLIKVLEINANWRKNYFQIKEINAKLRC